MSDNDDMVRLESVKREIVELEAERASEDFVKLPNSMQSKLLSEIGAKRRARGELEDRVVRADGVTRALGQEAIDKLEVETQARYKTRDSLTLKLQIAADLSTRLHRSRRSLNFVAALGVVWAVTDAELTEFRTIGVKAVDSTLIPLLLASVILNYLCRFLSDKAWFMAHERRQEKDEKELIGKIEEEMNNKIRPMVRFFDYQWPWLFGCYSFIWLLVDWYRDTHP